MSQAPGALQIETVADDHAVSVSIGGEVDVSNHEQLGAALAAIPHDGPAVVHLRLADLTFCDLHCLRQLVGFARRVRDTGRQVLVHDANGSILRVAQLLGADDDLGFR